VIRGTQIYAGVSHQRQPDRQFWLVDAKSGHVRHVIG
jgi:hypothetical protein